MDETPTDFKVLEAESLPAACGVVLMIFVSHAEAPILYQEMENREEWPRAAILGMGMSSCIFMVAAVLGYGIFGDAVQQSFSLNLGRDLHLKELPGSFNPFFARLSAGLMALKLTATQPLIAAPIAQFVQEKADWNKVGLIVFKLLLMVVTTILCVSLSDEMVRTKALVGCVVENLIAIILPCITYLRLKQLQGESISLPRKVALQATSILATVYMVIATYNIIADPQHLVGSSKAPSP